MVVDLGSNIGATCAYWRTRAPAAAIVAVEPEKSNSGMLRLNLDGDAAVEDAAVADTSGWAQFDTGERSTGHHLAAATDANDGPGSGTRTLTPDDILRAHRPTRVGLLKVDIEGAEEAVFTRAWDLLDVTDKIVMEIHDDAVRPRIVAALAEQGFEHHRPAGPRDMADLFVRRDGDAPSP
jgi:FkbM family methyltransferase